MPAKKAPARSTAAKAKTAKPEAPQPAEETTDNPQPPENPAVTGPRGAGKPRGDMTGQQVVRDQQRHAEELAERASEISTINTPPPVNDDDDDDDEVTDYTGDAPTSEVERQERDAEAREAERRRVVEVDTGEVQTDVTVRIKETVTNLYFGAGKAFDFHAGRSYKVNRHLADHLREKGIAWD